MASLGERWRDYVRRTGAGSVQFGGVRCEGGDACDVEAVDAREERERSIES